MHSVFTNPNMLKNDVLSIYNSVYKLHTNKYSCQKHALWIIHLIFITTQLTLNTLKHFFLLNKGKKQTKRNISTCMIKNNEVWSLQDLVSPSVVVLDPSGFADKVKGEMTLFQPLEHNNVAFKRLFAIKMLFCVMKFYVLCIIYYGSLFRPHMHRQCFLIVNAKLLFM